MPGTFASLRGALLWGTVIVTTSTGLLTAHDFWIVPIGFGIDPDSQVEILGQTGTRFPTTVSAVVPERVADARLISATGEERITDLSVSGKSLRLRHRPTDPGQRIVAVALVTRSARAATAGLKRYIALEGAPELAEHYERAGAFAATDSVTQLTTKYAKTVVEVGRGGARAFSRPAGHALEFVPLSDPSSLRIGDSLAIRLQFRGQPLANAHLHAGAAPERALEDSTAVPREKDLSLTTNQEGVALVPLGHSGMWNVRTLHAAPAASSRTDWEVAFATIVFRVADRAF
jgi:hypothetical protein